MNNPIMFKDEMTSAQFRKMLARGMITTSKKGKLVMSPDVSLNDELSLIQPKLGDELQFNPDDYIFIGGRVYSSKNSKRVLAKPAVRSKWKCEIKGVWKISTPFVSDSVAVTKYKKEKRVVYESYLPYFKKMLTGKTPPYYIEFVFVMPTRQKFDFNNMTELVQDIMVDCGWLPDDNVNVMVPVPPPQGKPVYYVNKNNPGVYIKVL